MEPTPFTNTSIAARITEKDLNHPSLGRCWQPTDYSDTVVEYEYRFGQPGLTGLTENLILWNVPFSDPNSSGITSIGVTRNSLYNGYFASVTQDVQFTPQGLNGFVRLAPVPATINPTDWHKVRITMYRNNDVKIEMKQGTNGYTTLLQTTLPRRTDPLAFEFSMDNELTPPPNPVRVPVNVTEKIDVASFVGYPILHFND
jgi:hypothetical protein